MAGQEQQTHLSDENELLLFPLIYCNGSQGTFIAHIFWNQSFKTKQHCKCDLAMCNSGGWCVSICLCLSISFVDSSRYKWLCWLTLEQQQLCEWWNGDFLPQTTQKKQQQDKTLPKSKGWHGRPFSITDWLWLEVSRNHNMLLTCLANIKKGFECERRSSLLLIEKKIKALDSCYLAQLAKWTR